jgi:hypothetical protein
MPDHSTDHSAQSRVLVQAESTESSSKSESSALVKNAGFFRAILCVCLLAAATVGLVVVLWTTPAATPTDLWLYDMLRTGWSNGCATVAIRVPAWASGGPGSNGDPSGCGPTAFFLYMITGSPPLGLNISDDPSRPLAPDVQDKRWETRSRDWLARFTTPLTPFFPGRGTDGGALPPIATQPVEEKDVLLANAACALGLASGSCEPALLVQFLLLGDFSCLARINPQWSWNNNHILTVMRPGNGRWWYVFMGWAGRYNLTDWVRADRPGVRATAFQAPLDEKGAAMFLSMLSRLLRGGVLWREALPLAQELFFLGSEDVDQLGWASVPPTYNLSWAIATNAWGTRDGLVSAQSGFDRYRTAWWPTEKKVEWSAYCSASE